MATVKGLLHLLLQDLRGSSAVRSLWVFSASLILGITLVSAVASLLQLVSGGFDEQQRKLFGGDLQISQREAVTSEQLSWLNSNADVSLLLELRTMLGSPAGEFSVVELQSVDDAYPLYGNIKLMPEQSLNDAVAQSANGTWGAVFDPILQEQLDLNIGQHVSIGSLEFELRAMIVDQPDRSLRADVRGPPVIVDIEALEQSGLLLPTSLVGYDYRIRTVESPGLWRDRLRAAFPSASWEVQTVDERGDFVSERLDQVASVMLLIGFSTLFIGGLGVSNSVGAYMQTKYRTLATLQALGSPQKHVAGVYIGQIALLGMMASAVGAVLGSIIAWSTAVVLARRLPIDTSLSNLLQPLVLSIVFGTLVALLFALPALGRTLTLPTARLIRGATDDSLTVPLSYRSAVLLLLIVIVALLMILVPEPLIGLIFIVLTGLMLVLLELTTLSLQYFSRTVSVSTWLDRRFALRLAVASIARKGSSLRPMLLSLGTALTLLVAAALVIAATVQTLDNAVPELSPSLVFHDLQQPDRMAFENLVTSLDGFEHLSVAPLVLGRLTSVNGEQLSSSDVAQRALEANDEHKLSYRIPGIDNTEVDRGAWWPDNYDGPTLVAMEDREADQLGLQVGDQLEFTIMQGPVNASLAAIYSQGRFQTSFWLEAVFSNDVLDPYITRNIGSIRLQAGKDVNAMTVIGNEYPTVVVIRTAKILAAVKSVLSSASLALMAIAAVSMSASILVMASVVAVSRQRQIYEASVMHAIGSPMKLIIRGVFYEYALIAVVLTIFATIVGSIVAWLILEFWLKLQPDGVWHIGLLVASTASVTCLLAGAAWLVKSLLLTPAMLLRRGVQ